MEHYFLVGDVGGTNIRLALCNWNTGNISNVYYYSICDAFTLEHIIHRYIIENKIILKEACIAIACPVDNDCIKMTNYKWSFSIKKMQKNLGLDKLKIINDFNATSMSIPMLTNKDIIQLGGINSIPGKPIVVYGAGTGLGVSHLIKVNKQWISFPGEGGHVDFASNNIEEDNILSMLRKDLGHVSAERVLSGPGLVHLYRAIVISKGRIPKNLLPNEVTKRALSNICVDSHRALSLFCVLMGRFGGNLALSMGTFGGVYIAGGLILRFLKFFCNSDFRLAFEDKGRLKNYLLNIPVYLIKYQHSGLLGAGAYMRQYSGINILNIS